MNNVELSNVQLEYMLDMIELGLGYSLYYIRRKLMYLSNNKLAISGAKNTGKRRSYGYNTSIIFMDEFSILYPHDTIFQIEARLFRNALKDCRYHFHIKPEFSIDMENISYHTNSYDFEYYRSLKFKKINNMNLWDEER